MKKISVSEFIQIEVLSSDVFGGNPTLEVTEGEVYSFAVLPHQSWTDSFIKTDANGFWNPLLFFTGKRVSQARCFELCGTINRNEEHHFIIGLALENYKIEHSGELFFFANDSKKLKFYGNNKGAILLRIQRIK